MADNALTIERNSVFDNSADRQVEFRASIDDEAYDFAVQYSVLEALSGVIPVTEPAATFAGYSGPIAKAGLSALARSNGDDLVVISENDLDQTPSTGSGPHAGPEPDGLPAGTGAA